MSQTVVPRKQAARTSCGFCESTHGQPAGICHDADRRCKGTWPGFVPASLSNTTEGQTYAQVAQPTFSSSSTACPVGQLMGMRPARTVTSGWRARRRPGEPRGTDCSDRRKAMTDYVVNPGRGRSATHPATAAAVTPTAGSSGFPQLPDPVQ
jgi:hypothetical protein